MIMVAGRTGSSWGRWVVWGGVACFVSGAAIVMGSLITTDFEDPSQAEAFLARTEVVENFDSEEGECSSAGCSARGCSEQGCPSQGSCPSEGCPESVKSSVAVAVANSEGVDQEGGSCPSTKGCGSEKECPASAAGVAAGENCPLEKIETATAAEGLSAEEIVKDLTEGGPVGEGLKPLVEKVESTSAEEEAEVAERSGAKSKTADSVSPKGSTPRENEINLGGVIPHVCITEEKELPILGSVETLPDEFHGLTGKDSTESPEPIEESPKGRTVVEMIEKLGEGEKKQRNLKVAPDTDSRTYISGVPFYDRTVMGEDFIQEVRDRIEAGNLKGAGIQIPRARRGSELQSNAPQVRENPILRVVEPADRLKGYRELISPEPLTEVPPPVVRQEILGSRTRPVPAELPAEMGVCAKAEHLRVAAQELDEAGLPDLAAELRKKAEEAQQAFQLEQERNKPVQLTGGQVQELQKRLAELREEVKQLKEMIEGLKQEVAKGLVQPTPIAVPGIQPIAVPGLEKTKGEVWLDRIGSENDAPKNSPRPTETLPPDREESPALLTKPFSR